MTTCRMIIQFWFREIAAKFNTLLKLMAHLLKMVFWNFLLEILMNRFEAPKFIFDK